MRGKREAPKKNKTSNIILLVLGVFLFTFIVMMIITYWKFQSVPDMLIQCVLGTGGLEGILLAAIKIVKLIKEKKEDKQDQDGNGDGLYEQDFS